MVRNSDDEPLISHLEALRSALIKCFAALAIMLLPSFFIAPKGLEFFLKIISGDNKVTFNFFSPVEVFILQIKLALLISVVISFPYIVKQIWDFILPALYDNEKKLIKSIVILSSILFISGVLFCLFFILPLIINFGMSFSTGEIRAVFGISNVVNLSLWLLFVFGLMFQVPLVTNMLIRSGFVTYGGVSDKRPYVAVVLLIISALLTPPDVVSQIMLFTPTYMLFELGLMLSRVKNKEV